MNPGQEERDVLINAYFDGELDVVEARRFEARLAADPDLANDLARLKQLRNQLRSDLADDVPSEALRRRIRSRFVSSSWMRSQSWQALAASMIIGFVVGSAATFGVFPSRTSDTTADQVVASHLRALMAPSPADVASSDHHTVKPWFDGKIAFAPQVAELASVGFPLVGGRLDVVGLQPVPALVYQAGTHLISVFEIPGEGVSPREPVESIDRGYVTVSWTEGGVTYWAVSDASEEAMQSFVRALRAAVKSPSDGMP
jgi:anti-sigma factor RsiW